MMIDLTSMLVVSAARKALEEIADALTEEAELFECEGGGYDAGYREASRKAADALNSYLDRWLRDTP